MQQPVHARTGRGRLRLGVGVWQVWPGSPQHGIQVIHQAVQNARHLITVSAQHNGTESK